MNLPAGWVSFNLNNSASTASLDAFIKANPGLAGAIQTFRSTPNVRMATNTLLGDLLIVLAIPSQGLTLDTIGQSLSAQFQTVSGATSKAAAKPVSLPGGDALHWDISVAGNKIGGGKVQVEESIYLVTNGQTAIIAEFVTPHGGVNPYEAMIIQTLRFRR